MFVIDTNVLVYAANRESEFHEPCRQRIETCRQQASPWYLSWPICYEFMRVCTHPSVLSRPWTIAGAWNFLETMLDAPGGGLLIPTLRRAAVFAEVAAELPHLRGNILHDAHTAVLMREHGIRDLYTRDADFCFRVHLEALD